MAATEPSSRPAALDRLLAVTGYPCVTVLVATQPGATMSPGDRNRLDRLVAEVERRLIAELPRAQVRKLLTDLTRLAARVMDKPCRRSLALFVGPGVTTSMTLTVSTRDRVVVDATFATRDLVRHINRTTTFWLLTISERMARLFLGDDQRLIVFDGDPFVSASDGEERPGRARRDRSAFLREVAAAVDGVLLGDRAPLVIAGVERMATDFAGYCRTPAIGVVRGGHDRTPPGRLHHLAWPLVTDWLRTREHTALDDLDRAHSARRLATGLDEIWSLAADGRVDLLVVEEGFEVPARVLDDAHILERAEDRDAPDVIDDAVDDLVEVVLGSGGRAVFVGDGTLAGQGRIAAALRY